MEEGIFTSRIEIGCSMCKKRVPVEDKKLEAFYTDWGQREDKDAQMLVLVANLPDGPQQISLPWICPECLPAVCEALKTLSGATKTTKKRRTRKAKAEEPKAPPPETAKEPEPEPEPEEAKEPEPEEPVPEPPASDYEDDDLFD